MWNTTTSPSRQAASWPGRANDRPHLHGSAGNGIPPYEVATGEGSASADFAPERFEWREDGSALEMRGRSSNDAAGRPPAFAGATGFPDGF